MPVPRFPPTPSPSRRSWCRASRTLFFSSSLYRRRRVLQFTGSTTCGQSVKAASGWGPQVANFRVEKGSFSPPRSAPAQACRQSPPRASALRVPAVSANGGGSEPGWFASYVVVPDRLCAPPAPLVPKPPLLPPPGARRPDFMLACETLVAEGGAGTRGLHSPNISASIASLSFRDPIPTLVTWQVPF